MTPLSKGVALAVPLMAALPGQDLPPWLLLLARVKQHGRGPPRPEAEVTAPPPPGRFR